MEPACKITRYDCSDPEQFKRIKELIDAANEQQDKNHGFIKIFPWLGGCDLAPRHYVAQRADGTICGWMTVIPKEQDGTKYLYLSEISVTRIREDAFKGVGKRLHETLVQDGKKEGMAFIYLVPVDSTVVKPYQAWGYFLPEGDVVEEGDTKAHYMFFSLQRGQPTPEMMEAIKPKEPEPDEYIDEALARVDPEEEADLYNLIEAKRDLLKKNPNLVSELKDVIGTIQMYESWEEDESTDEDTLESIPPVEERLNMIRAVFEKATGGKRRKTRTRRHKTRKRTKRIQKH